MWQNVSENKTELRNWWGARGVGKPFSPKRSLLCCFWTCRLPYFPGVLHLLSICVCAGTQPFQKFHSPHLYCICMDQKNKRPKLSTDNTLRLSLFSSWRDWKHYLYSDHIWLYLVDILHQVIARNPYLSLKLSLSCRGIVLNPFEPVLERTNNNTLLRYKVLIDFDPSLSFSLFFFFYMSCLSVCPVFDKTQKILPS